MQLTIVGGGGFRTPLVYGELLRDPQRLIDRVVLVDNDATRLQVIADVLAGQRAASAAPNTVEVRTTTDLRDGLRGADFVFAAIRAGGLAGRVADENIPLSHGVLGQETTGLGGVLYGLRSIPAMYEIARAIGDVAPQAWLINFTNPAGMVTEALQSALPGRVIGICDSPSSLVRRVARALRLPDDDLEIDYVGLNHLGWLRAASHSGTDLLPGLLADEALLGSFEEGQLFGAELIRSLKAIPNEYLHYYYFATDVLASLVGKQTRASYLHDQQSAFYRDAAASNTPYAVWQSVVDERNRTYMATSREAAGADERAEEDVEGGGYERIALAVMRAIATNSGQRLILNVPNAGAVAALDADAVIEVACQVDARGARPLPIGPLTEHQAGLMLQVKAVERWTIEAALTGSRDALHAALATHPLNGSYAVARRVLDEWLLGFPEVRRTCGRNPSQK